MTAALPRATALALALMLVATSAWADDPADGGAPTDAAPPSSDAAPPPVVTTTPPPPKPDPHALVSAPAAPPDQPRARPTPLHRSALFWTSVILGAGAVAAIAVGIGLAATYHSRYALVTF